MNYHTFKILYYMSAKENNYNTLIYMLAGCLLRSFFDSTFLWLKFFVASF